MTPLRIGFVHFEDAANPMVSSGAPSSVRRALKAEGHEVTDLFPIETGSAVRGATLAGRIIQKAYSLLGRDYDYKRETAFQAICARELKRRLKGKELDVLFTQTNFCVSALDTEIPIVFAADQPYPCLFEGYTRRASNRMKRLGFAQSIRAIDMAKAIFVSSSWAKERFSHYFPGSERKVEVIPWGANLTREPSSSTVDALIQQRVDNPDINILFVGKDWDRKGGSIVVDAVDELNNLGLKVNLTIVGCDHPIDQPRFNYRNVPFLDRSTDAGENEFADLLSNAHFMFVPSRFEAYGHVFCEAAAYGLPSATKAVGGIGEIVHDGENGIILPEDRATAVEFAKRISEAFSDKALYRKLSEGARSDYLSRLSWSVFAKGVLNKVDALRKA